MAYEGLKSHNQILVRGLSKAFKASLGLPLPNKDDGYSNVVFLVLKESMNKGIDQ